MTVCPLNQEPLNPHAPLNQHDLPTPRSAPDVHAYTVAQIRRLEATAMAVQGDAALMQRAAHGLSVVLADELRARVGGVYGARVLILVGPGNNGGDALYAGQRLAARGAAVLAVACLGTPHAAGLAALLAVGGRVVDLSDVSGEVVEVGNTSVGGVRPWDLAVDGILGIGGRPGLPEPVAAVVQRLAEADVPVVAVDLPSGVDADTGACGDGAARAVRTVTFGTLKPCHLLEPARERCARLDLVDIGLDLTGETPALEALTLDDLAAWWPYPGVSSDKYARGVVGIDTGSELYPGAGILSTFGAVHAGAGMVRYLGPSAAADIIVAQLPNVVFSPGRVQARLLGSGWGDRPDGTAMIAAVLDEGVPAVVDADGLRFLPESVPSGWLLTPHAGELARLLDLERSAVEADPVRAVRAAANSTGATVLLKGATQLVAAPHATSVLVALPGPAWTAQAGSGDTLAGICAALLAAGVPADRAGQLGASVQAWTAHRHPGALTPHEIAREVAGSLGLLEARDRENRRGGAR